MKGWRKKGKVRARERAGDGEITDCSCGTSERAQPAGSRAKGRCHIFFFFPELPAVSGKRLLQRLANFATQKHVASLEYLG